MKFFPTATLIFLFSDANVVSGTTLTNEPGRHLSQKRDVTLTLSSSKTHFSTDEPVLIDITLANNEVHKPARILSWVNPCNNDGQSSGLPKEMSFFNIGTSDGGYVAKYLGALFKRGKPVETDYEVLMPGDQISCAIDLRAFYEFAAASDNNDYAIKYLVDGMQLSGPNNNGNAIESLESNMILVKVDTNHSPPTLRGRNHRQLAGTNLFSDSCTSSNQQDIATARSKAHLAALSASDCLNTVSKSGRSDHYRYDEWFGSYNSVRNAELVHGFTNIGKRLNDALITFNCNCQDSSVYAYVYSNQPFTIYLCGAFWSAGMSGTDSKLGTLIHEMSHFTVTADTDDHAYGQSNCRDLADSSPSNAINNADSTEYFAENSPSLSCAADSIPEDSSCMSGNTRVSIQPSAEFKTVRDLSLGDIIQGLNENMELVECAVEAIGHFGSGPTYGNYTGDHFILNVNENVVLPNGDTGEMEVVDKYAVLTSCPVGLDESGVGFTPVDGDFLGHDALDWSDYVVVHQAILDVVRVVGSFVFSPSTYTSMEKVKQYTNNFYQTMLRCAKNSKTCNAFEKAAMDLVENALTDEAKVKISNGFSNFGRPEMPGSIAAVVSKGNSVNHGPKRKLDVIAEERKEVGN